MWHGLGIGKFSEKRAVIWWWRKGKRWNQLEWKSWRKENRAVKKWNNMCIIAEMQKTKPIVTLTLGGKSQRGQMPVADCVLFPKNPSPPSKGVTVQLLLCAFSTSPQGRVLPGRTAGRGLGTCFGQCSGIEWEPLLSKSFLWIVGFSVCLCSWP